MEYLLNDYTVFGDSEILTQVSNKANEINDAYYEGKYTKEVNTLIRRICNNNELSTFFLTAGTQTNALCLSALLKPYEAIISADTAHINTLEAGSVENLGHKIIQLPSKEGKINVEDIKSCIKINNDKHRVKPKVVYISQPTELGTMYTESELKSLREVCNENNLLLFLDGARLCVALAKDENINLEKYSKYTDIFYFGGTKNGLPLGEMVISRNKEFSTDFRFYMKQNGALLAKGEFVSFMFLKLLENNKYLTLAKHSLVMAKKLQDYLESKNIKFSYTPQTNQLFIILNNNLITELSKNFKFTIWEEYNENETVIRLVTSFATKSETIENFIKELEKY